MTVKELIERLGAFPPETSVYVQHDTYPALPLLAVEAFEVPHDDVVEICNMKEELVSTAHVRIPVIAVILESFEK